MRCIVSRFSWADMPRRRFDMVPGKVNQMLQAQSLSVNMGPPRDVVCAQDRILHINRERIDNKTEKAHRGRLWLAMLRGRRGQQDAWKSPSFGSSCRAQVHASSNRGNRENKRQGAVVTNPFIVPSAKSVAAVFPTVRVAHLEGVDYSPSRQLPEEPGSKFRACTVVGPRCVAVWVYRLHDASASAGCPPCWGRRSHDVRGRCEEPPKAVKLYCAVDSTGTVVCVCAGAACSDSRYSMGNVGAAHPPRCWHPTTPLSHR